MTGKEIKTVLEEAEALLINFNRVLVYFKYNDHDEVIDTLIDSHRNDLAERNGYYLEYIFEA